MGTGDLGCIRVRTGDVRLDIVQIPYEYRTDITEPLPLYSAAFYDPRRVDLHADLHT